jgi:CheY-like chemotaxis protein
MIESLKFIVVEDKDSDRRNVLDRLSDEGFAPENKLGEAGTYEEAKALIEEHAEALDVLFLDLNLPRHQLDGQPEKGHGRALLDLVHKDMNRRAGADIRVIIISGEHLHDGLQHEVLIELYRGTLLGIVQKTNLSKMLRANIKRLKKDPLRSRMLRGELDGLDAYDTVTDPAQPALERIKSARTLAIRLVQHWADYCNGESGSCARYADDLNGLIKEQIESRFSPDLGGRQRIKASSISCAGGWGSFLWRGSTVQHLYSINSYRNCFEHIGEQPFRNTGQEPDLWNIPHEVLERVESGETACKIVELTVRELLAWYLPWHEQVYLPWIKGQAHANARRV